MTILAHVWLLLRRHFCKHGWDMLMEPYFFGPTFLCRKCGERVVMKMKG